VGKEGELLEDMLVWNGPCVPGPSSVLIKREVIDSIGVFDPDLSTAADMDLFIRIAASYPIGHLNEKTWLYRIHDGNMHVDISIMQRDLITIYKKVDKSGLLVSRLRRKAYGVMFRILGASWLGDGGSYLKGLWFLLRSILIYPGGIKEVLRRGKRKF
jgi:hypothetical protein